MVGDKQALFVVGNVTMNIKGGSVALYRNAYTPSIPRTFRRRILVSGT